MLYYESMHMRKAAIYAIFVASITILYGYNKKTITPLPEDIISTPTNIPTQQTVASKDITLLFAGDIMLARGVQSYQPSRSELWPLDKIAENVQSADIAFGNLESPVGPESTLCIDCFRFGILPSDAEILKNVGFDVLSVANNHTNDFPGSPQKTLETLQSLGLDTTGFVADGQKQVPVIIEIEDLSIGFLAYTDITNTTYANIAYADTAQMRTDIEELSNDVDLLIISIHWGTEYTYQVTARQTELGRTAIEAGADMVIGHHPHWIQGIEVFQEKPIFYSLGNTVFNMMHTEETREGLLIKLTVTADRNSVVYEVIPTVLEDYAQPNVVAHSNKRYSNILQILQNHSTAGLQLPQFSLAM